MAKIVMTVPAQRFEVDFDGDSEDRDFIYDAYVHHMVQSIEWTYEVK